MTQFELAEAVGIDEKHLSHIETGRSFPKANLIEKFLDILNIDLNTLFDFPIEINRNILVDKINEILKTVSDEDLNKIYRLMDFFVRR